MGNYSAEQNASAYPLTTQDWFNKDALHRANLQAMREVVGNGRYKCVLDWGCGNLLWSLALFPGAAITGVELSAECLHYAELNAKCNGSAFRPVLLQDIDALEHEQYDAAIAVALIELLSPEQFDETFSTIQRALRAGAPLFVTFHNWRQFSALYLSWLGRGGYDAYCQRLGTRISRKALPAVLEDFQRLGFDAQCSGAYNPYPSKLWTLIRPWGYRTENRFLTHWYCTQYAVLRKRPYSS